MADIHIHRSHTLGLAKARKTAWQWAEAVEAEFAMECTVVEGEERDVVEFTRPGVTGRLVVEAASFELEAKLGFLLGVFSRRIESEIEAKLDALLAAAPKIGQKAASKAAPRRAAKRKA